MKTRLADAQLVELRTATRKLAAELPGQSLADAFMTMFIPDYVWAAMVAARDEAAPAAPRDEDVFPDLLAADTPERDAAAKATWDAIVAAVVAPDGPYRERLDAASAGDLGPPHGTGRPAHPSRAA